MPADAPAADAPQAQPSIKEQAIAQAREVIASRSSTETTDTGTGAAPAAITPEKPAPKAAAEKPASDEPDWTNAEARAAYLKEQADKHEADVQKRLNDQKTSFRRDLDLASATKRRQELGAELDELRRVDPETYAERISTDREAADLVRSRMDEIPEEAQHRFIIQAMSTYAEQAFEVAPALRELAGKPDSPEWLEAADPKKGGLFGFIQRAALEEGKRAGVEAFKSSKEYKDAISAAERRAAHNVGGGMETNGPAVDDSTGAAGDAPPDYGSDLAKAAVASAMRSSPGGGRSLDVSRIRDPRRKGATTRSA